MQPNSELFHSAAPDPCPSPVPEPWPSPSPQPSPLPILSQLKYDKFTLKMIGLNYNAIIEIFKSNDANEKSEHRIYYYLVILNILDCYFLELRLKYFLFHKNNDFAINICTHVK